MYEANCAGYRVDEGFCQGEECDDLLTSADHGVLCPRCRALTPSLLLEDRKPEARIVDILTHGEPTGWPVKEFMEQAWEEEP